MISLKNDNDIAHLRKAGRVVADVLMLMKDIIKPGLDTLSLDRRAEDHITSAGGIPAFKGYKVPGIAMPFPGTLCVSINSEVVHGIPSSRRLLEEGDIVSVDVGVLLEGYYGDAAFTYPVGKVTPERQELMEVTRESLERAVNAAREGSTLGDVGHAVESCAIPRGFGIVRNYAGHGIGKNLHEPPQVPNFGTPGRGIALKSGMTLAIEPMIMTGNEAVRTLRDKWTVVTSDGSDAAHFEKTIVVTDGEAEVLTPWE